MKVYPEELQSYARYKEEHYNNSYPGLEAWQIKEIKKRAKTLRSHQLKFNNFYNFLNVIVIIFILTSMTFLSFILPSLYKLSSFEIILTALVFGHFNYSLTIFTLHEGNSHKGIIEGHGKIHQVLRFFVYSLCRLNFADPESYKEVHPSHHNKVGTKDDQAYTQFVWPSRFFISLLPFVSSMRFCDYKIHTTDTWTKSKMISEFLSFSLYGGILLNFYLNSYSIFSFLLFFMFATWSSFTLDRLRETSEHNLMPDDGTNVARSFGLSFWGLLTGGGPWGQPCHLIHHLAPSASWLHQIVLHYELKKILNFDQKAFLMESSPLLIIRLVKDNFSYSKALQNEK